METWIPVVLAIVTPALAGIGWLVKSARDAQVNRELALAKEVHELQQEVKNLLQDRIQYELVRFKSIDQTMSVLNQILDRLKEDGK